VLPHPQPPDKRSGQALSPEIIGIFDKGEGGVDPDAFESFLLSDLQGYFYFGLFKSGFAFSIFFSHPASLFIEFSNGRREFDPGAFVSLLLLDLQGYFI